MRLGIVGDSPVREGFVSGFLLIFFSEMGDKTFLIALLLALKKSKLAVFTGTFGALAVMTVISVALGQTLHQLDELVPQGARSVPYDDLIAAALLVWFGLQTLKVLRAIEPSDPHAACLFAIFTLHLAPLRMPKTLQRAQRKKRGRLKRSLTALELVRFLKDCDDHGPQSSLNPHPSSAWNTMKLTELTLRSES